MSPEEIRGWVAIALGAVATISVAIIGARAAWRNSRKSSTEAVELKTWPTYGELVTENRNLRREVDDLREGLEELRGQIGEVNRRADEYMQLELVMFRYFSALRHHVTMGFPPPPPPVPAIIADRFEDFEATYPPGEEFPPFKIM